MLIILVEHFLSQNDVFLFCRVFLTYVQWQLRFLLKTHYLKFQIRVLIIS